VQRLVEFGQRYGITIRLAYYPPYPSQVQPDRTLLGYSRTALEALLDSVEAVIRYASTMTWKGKHPAVALVMATYQTGVKLTKQAMDALETQLQRLPHLDKWFVDIGYPSPAIRVS
jgi:hypothetical protein